MNAKSKCKPEELQEMLDRDMTPLEVAEEVGYKCPSYIYQLIKKHGLEVRKKGYLGRKGGDSMKKVLKLVGVGPMFLDEFHIFGLTPASVREAYKWLVRNGNDLHCYAWRGRGAGVKRKYRKDGTPTLPKSFQIMYHEKDSMKALDRVVKRYPQLIGNNSFWVNFGQPILGQGVVVQGALYSGRKAIRIGDKAMYYNGDGERVEVKFKKHMNIKCKCGSVMNLQWGAGTYKCKRCGEVRE